MRASIQLPDYRRMDLSKSSIKNLRAESHRLKLKPVVMIGQHGLSDNVHNEIDIALGHHELIKVRVPGQEREDKKAMIDSLCKKHHADLIQSIGNVAVIYRRNKEIDRYAKFLK